MNSALRRLIFIILLLSNFFAFAQKANTHQVTYDGNSLKIDGQEIFIYGAAFHYFRCPKELWRDRFAKIKEAGFNTVETYIPWNVHELNMPSGLNDSTQFNFSEVKEWLRMAQNEFGFYTIVRPGPFICAEWAGGGYPRWLAKFRPDIEGFWLRSADPEHIKWSEHWYKAVCKIIAAEEITRKPKNKKGIILMQIENEYDAHNAKNKTAFLERLYNVAKQAGVSVPVFTCLTSQCRGAKGELSQVFDCDNYYVDQGDAITCAKRMESLKSVQPNAPGFVTELQGGWFSTVMGKLSEEHPSDAAHFYAIAMMSIAGGATGLIQYVTYGGTHFAGWGARGQTTSYDYNASVREDGSLSPKYFAAQNVGKFISVFGHPLIHSRGGVCSFSKGGEELAGAVRISADGTKFVFLHNHSAKNKISGTATVQPQDKSPAAPLFNINQNEEKVEMTDARTKNNLAGLKPFSVSYELLPMQTKVLIIPPKKTADKGKWWVWDSAPVAPPKEISVRIAQVLKYNEDAAKAAWKPLPEGMSLPELGVNDARYVLYRSQFTLDENEASQYSKILFNAFSRDILNVEVNGQLAPRLYPSEKWASLVWRDVDKSFKKIKENDYDNRFDAKNLLRRGKNEIIALYENIGHEHGYYPMEELCGIRKAGLSDNETVLKKPLAWEVSVDLAGIPQQFTSPEFTPHNWQTIDLDSNYDVPRKGNEIQPKGKQDALFTWYRAAFDLPESNDTWRLLINASGNGYMYLNGHNIGRHWEGGPQREYYLPECWLNKGKNVLVLGLRQTANGAVIRGMEIKNSISNEK